MAGLAKGLAILEAFGPQRRQMTLAEAAREAGLTRATARRCLLTLTEAGYLAHDGKYFRPLPRLLRLGFAYLRADPLTEMAQAVLAGVRDAAGESVSLSILEDGDVLFVARSAVPRLVTDRVDVGARLPACCSASGLVLLAGLAPPALDAWLARTRLVARTPRSPTDKAALRMTLDAVRQDGVAVNDEILETGLRALAVPVRDGDGAVRAALSVSAAAARLTVPAMHATFLPLLQEAALMLGRALG